MRNRRQRRRSQCASRLTWSRKLLAEPLEPRRLLATFAEVDVCAIDASANQSIIVQFTDAPQNRPAVRLYDGADNLVASNSIGLGLRAQVPADGTYYVQMASDNTSGTVTGQYMGYASVHGNTVWQETRVTASAAGYQDDEVHVLVSDGAKLIVAIASGAISEFAGTTNATVTRDNTNIDEPLVVSLLVTDDTEASLPTEVTIGANQTSATFTITALDDDLLDGTQTLDVVAKASGYLDGRAPLDVADHEQLLVVPTDLSFSENGGGTMVRIERPNTDRDKALTVNLSLRLGVNETGMLTFASLPVVPDWATIPSRVEIPAGQASATVTLSAVDDAIDAEHPSIVIAAAAGGYVEGEQTIDIIDDDQAGISVSAIDNHTTETGGTGDFTIVLDSEPTADVTVAIRSDDDTEGVVSADSLTFTAADWDTPQIITVTGLDDDVDDGDVAFFVVLAAAASGDDKYDGLDAGDVVVTNQDDDSAGITVTAISGDTTEAGGEASFSIVLHSEPTADVTIALSSDDTSEGDVMSQSVTFTPYDWDTPQVVTVTGVDDMIDDGDVVFHIEPAAAISGDSAYSGMQSQEVSVRNLDDDTAGVIVSAIDGDTSELGDTTSYTLVLTSEPVGEVRIDLWSTDLDEGVTAPESVFFTFGDWDTPQTVTVTGVDDDIDDGDIDYQILTTVTSATDTIYDGIRADDVDVRNLDDDTAGIFVSSISGDTSEMGAVATFSIVLGSEPTAEVTIDLSSNDTTEGIVDVTSVTFTPGDWDVVQMVTVTGVDDALNDGDIVYEIITASAASLDEVYNGLDPNNIVVTNLDDPFDGLGWQNPIHACDINGDGFITAEDIIILINEINTGGPRELPMPPAPPHTPPPYLDPSGDNEITAVDILTVIQYLNKHGAGPAVGASNAGQSGGEGEAPPAATMSGIAAMLPPAPSGLVRPRISPQTRGIPFSSRNVDRPIRQLGRVSISSPTNASRLDAKHGLDFVMSRVEQHEDDRVPSLDLEGVLSDIADDVDRIWATS